MAVTPFKFDKYWEDKFRSHDFAENQPFVRFQSYLMATIVIVSAVFGLGYAQLDMLVQPVYLTALAAIAATQIMVIVATYKSQRWQTMVVIRWTDSFVCDLSFFVFIMISPVQYVRPLFTMFVIRLFVHYFVFSMPFKWFFLLQTFATLTLLGSFYSRGMLPTAQGGPWLAMMMLGVTHFIGALLMIRLDRLRRAAFLQHIMLHEEQRRSAELLRAVLPDVIASRLTDDRSELAEHVASATVVFADIVGFTELSRQLPARQVVKTLSELFGEFDAAALKHGVEKIKTIGDGYMAAAGVPEPCGDHVERALKFAVDIVACAKNYGERFDMNIGLRVGVHTGPVVAGVLATHRLAYDLWGETVNLASRLESTSIVGRIQVSAEVFRVANKTFQFEPPRKITLKGIGPTETYCLSLSS